ncbi:unnamed protein product, partial [Symbiodinium sp. KB8]
RGRMNTSVSDLIQQLADKEQEKVQKEKKVAERVKEIRSQVEAAAEENMRLQRAVAVIARSSRLLVAMGSSNRALCLHAVAAFFAGMGLVGIVEPGMVLHFFGLDTLPPDLRNEVRGVYGGFGLAIAALLVFTRRVERRRPDYALGLRTAVMVSLCGMAAGRLVSWAIESTTGPWPLVFFAVELALAFLLSMAMPESRCA